MSKVIFCIAVVVVSFVSLSGCETMMENYRATYCNYDGAYKKGMNDARGGQSMDEQVSGICLPEQKAITEKGYREGYSAYLQSAPRQVEINVNSGGYPMPSQCRFTTDCPFGKSCRNRGDGVHLCLGNEPRGGFCEFGADCSSGFFCQRTENNIGRCF